MIPQKLHIGNGQTVEAGSTVIYRGGFGGDPPKLATVVGLGAKDGEALVDLSDGHWTYLDQIDRVITKTSEATTA